MASSYIKELLLRKFAYFLPIFYLFDRGKGKRRKLHQNRGLKNYTFLGYTFSAARRSLYTGEKMNPKVRRGGGMFEIYRDPAHSLY